MINWKIVIIFVIFAVVFSLLGGLFGGVDFGEIILRSLIWGVIFGAVGLGIQVLMDNFLPELADAISGTSTPQNAREDKEEEPARDVDEVLPEINPHSPTPGNTQGESGSVEAEFIAQGDDSGEMTPIKDGLAPPEDKDENSAGSPGVPDVPGNPGGPDIPGNPGEGQDELDSLPDLESFAGSFSSFAGDIAPDSNVMADGTKDSVEIGGEQQDPTQVAKAIHTWMERDKKEG